MTRKKKKKLPETPLTGKTVAEVIELLKVMPQDAIVVLPDGDGGTLSVSEIHPGFAYHAFPGCTHIGQYSFARKEQVDNPISDVEAAYFARPPFSTSKTPAVELS
jgi:hypothetical protein